MKGNAGLDFLFDKAKEQEVVIINYIERRADNQDYYSLYFDGMTIKGTREQIADKIQVMLLQKSLTERGLAQ